MFKTLISQSSKLIILSTILSIIPLYSLFYKDLIYTQDGWTHLIRGAAYYKGILDHDFPVRWAGDLNYGYGMPLFIFVFQIPYILFALFLMLGLSLSLIFKILIFASFITSGITMFLAAKNFFKNNETALLVVILYQFFPYRFVDILLRGSIGEAFTFSFFPLLLLGVQKLKEKNKNLSLILIPIGVACLILSHLAIGMVFVAIGFLFMLFFTEKKEMVLGIFYFLLGFLLSSYYFFPALIEHKYTYGDLFARDLYRQNFPGLAKLFFPNLTNIVSLRVGDVPVTLGVVFSVLVILLIFSLFFIKRFSIKERKTIFFLSIIVFGSLFIMSDYSKIIWEKISIIRQFQFPWRFLSPIGFALAFFCGLLCIKFSIKKYFIVLIGIVTITSSVVYWTPYFGYKKVDEKAMWNYPLTTTYFGETDVIWAKGPAASYPKNRVDVIGGKGSVYDFYKKSSFQSFSVDAKTKVQLVDHTQYFPGWKVYIDNREVPIEFQDQNWRGQITFFVPSGKHLINVVFKEDKTRFMSDILSLCSFILIIILFRINRRKIYD